MSDSRIPGAVPLAAVAPTHSQTPTEDAVVAFVRSTIRPEIRAISAYSVAKATGMIKLDAMENPYGLSDEARTQIADAVACVAINRYPDGRGDAVKQALRTNLGLPDGVDVVLGNGSDELLQILTMVVAKPGAVILAPSPSFVMYRLNALYANVRFVEVPLEADFSLDVDAMLTAIERERPSLVWLAYPNNPTGNLFELAAVERIIRSAPGLVVVDEAYYAFANSSFLSRVLDFPNLIVVRTLSKIGLAGVRLGYAIAHPAWIGELDKVRAPYNVSALTQAVVPILLEHERMLAEQAAAIRSERSRLADAMRAMRGVTVFPTQANFLLVRVADASHAFAALRDAGILVKNVDSWHPLLANCLRITVGTPRENDALLSVLATQE